MEKHSFLTIKEVADILQLHFQTVLNYIKSGKLNAIRLDKGYRISRKDLDEFIENNKTKNN